MLLCLRNNSLHPSFFSSFLDKFSLSKGENKIERILLGEANLGASYFLVFPTGPMVIILMPYRELSVFKKLARRVN